MTKKDIMLAIAQQPGLSRLNQVEIKKVIQATIDYLVEGLVNGQTIELRNFGVFKVKTRKGRMARNPKTGQKVAVPDRKVIVFKPGLLVKKRLNKR